ncbi:hypothetical protein RclHR1_06870011 [Rhizophagus clarus]|uniref:G-protein coupled receptors family 1 profile domain-containing protein n=1 Tax=Rhizophagus clarus TaxID=94130 RepID=A0A2Z6SA51_9GLOM|nr:hypothetical protein RclHR1_06870011 [Rhizophagus clarus]GES84814.1 hypothetical protein GLOIN_2v83430 [Rhizophagus clarus]
MTRMMFNPKINYSFLLLSSFLSNNIYAVPVETSLDKLHNEHSNIEIHIMYGLDLILLQLGSLCTLYLIVRTFVRWFKQNYSLYMSHKLPFYMAFSEFLIYTALIINLYYPAINDRQWPEQSCKIMGLMFYFFAIFNMILVGSVAVITYLRVCKAMNIDTGVLDYKLFICPLIVPIVLSVPAWGYFGSDGYWCFQDRNSTFIPLVLLYLNIIILMTSLFCYIGIAHAINVSRFRNDEENFRTSNKKIIGYLFMFILQWTPVMVYLIFDINKEPDMWIFVICIISLPAGAILNTYRYISHESFWNTYPEFGSRRDPSSRNETNLHSIKNFGGPPTVSQWRELSGDDDISNRSSILSERVPQVVISDRSEDSLDQIQNQSQLSLDIIQPQPSSSLSQNRSQDKIDKIHSQSSTSLSQNLPNRSQDKIYKIQSQSSSSLSQNSLNRSQDKINKIQSQSSSSLSQDLPNRSQDKIDKIQSQPSSSSSNQSQDKIDKIQSQPLSFLSQNRSQDKVNKIQTQPLSSFSQNSLNRSQDEIYKIQSQPSSSLLQNRSQDKLDKVQSQTSSSLLQSSPQNNMDNIQSKSSPSQSIDKDQCQPSSPPQNQSHDKINIRSLSDESLSSK